MIIIQTFGYSVSKACTNLSFVRMDYLLKYTPNDSTACIRKVKSIDSLSFLEIDSLYTITVGLWNKISSKWNRKAH